MIEINNFTEARPFYFITTAYYYPQYLAKQTYRRKTKDFSFDQVIHKRVIKSMGLFILFYFFKEFRLISFVLFVFFPVGPEIRPSSTRKTSYSCLPPEPDRYSRKSIQSSSTVQALRRDISKKTIQLYTYNTHIL